MKRTPIGKLNIFGIALLSLLLLSGTAAAGGVFAQDGTINATGSLYVGPTGSALFVNSTSGLVGIGTANSSRPLHIAAAQDANIRLQDTLGASPAAYIEFYNDTTRWGYFGLGGHDDRMVIGTTIEKNFSFYTNNTSRIVITPSGYVGIGTGSPNAMLQVVAPVNATGGSGGDSIYDIADGGVTYRVHKFTTAGNSTFAAPTGVGTVEVLVVAGGGRGGNNAGGGGGGGGLVYHPNKPVTAGTDYTITVGAGGNASSGNGSNSAFSDIVAIGGGAGGAGVAGGSPGGSGGGAGIDYGSVYPAGGAALQGNSNGGTGYGYGGGKGGLYGAGCGGGGGGAGGIGSQGVTFGTGNGGDGRAYPITGTPTYYAGGGGGGQYGGTPGLGGKGGGANGAASGFNGFAGTDGLGGGGGGAGNPMTGGNGGSGTVIVRYPISGLATNIQGSVGIGTTSPNAKLDVNGSIKLGSSAICDSSTEGSIKYDSAAKRVKFCNGTTWMPLQASACTNLGSCKQIFDSGCSTGDGIYTLTSGVSPMQAYCDMTNGGWTLCAYYDNSIDVADANSVNTPTTSVVGTRKCSNITDFTSVKAKSGNNYIALATTTWVPSGYSNKNLSVVSYNISASGQTPRAAGFIKANATSYALCIKTGDHDEADGSYNYKQVVCIGDWNRLVCDSGQCNSAPTYAMTQPILGTAYHYNAFNYCIDVTNQDWLFYNYTGENQACYATGTSSYYESGSVSIWVR